MRTWEDCQRDDLSHIPLAEALGWIPVFNPNDIHYDRVTPEFVPHNTVHFRKGNIITRKHYKSTDNGPVFTWKLYFENEDPVEFTNLRTILLLDFDTE